METFFRRQFWTVTLAFLALAALLLASTANQFTASLLWAGPGSVAGGAAPRARAPEARPRMDLEGLARITGLPVPRPEPEVKEPTEEQAVDMTGEPVKTSLRLKLLGTLVASNPDWSIASIVDVPTMKTGTYMVGHPVGGVATVLEILRNRVVILYNGRREYIDATTGDGSGAPPPPPPVAAAPAPQAKEPGTAVTGNGIRATSDNEYEVPRAEIDKTLSNLNDVAMQARIVPAFQDGQAKGFKLFSIRPDSIYTKIGIQNGDVIRRINGFDLNSPEKALEVYSKLKEANRIDIEVERNGSVLRKTYNVR
ncbi:MAG: general secretion pathway protein GspC [Deltaproteobacteria bacterium]|nr:general secretion pathway protein GspC [Deltaproteobacteria bacterium]